MERASKLIVFVTFLSIFGLALNSYAMDDCKATFINPTTDVRWEGVFPVEIAGVEIKGPSELKNPDKIGSVICMCRRGNKITLGVTVSYWDPARIVETVKVPYCFPTLGGLKINEPNPGTKQGGVNKDTGLVHQNAHWYLFNVWQILDLFMDIPCVPMEGVDIAYLTEIDPTWDNDLLGFLLNPEALLFGNPIAQLACIADSVSALAWWPLDPLFWCMGSLGSAYPMTGNIQERDYIAGNAGLASRMIYKVSREMLAWDPAVDKCGAVITPIWIKSHYKMHLIKPVRSQIIPIGRAPILWEHGKNPPWGTSKGAPDNFSWMVFRRVKCCLGSSF
ncbi:TraU family protein [Thermodesulfovibrio yellowstonii]|uniref:TraU family protein n=1 Tax=Thermodesulfovibrio yellowstonii TaxID=28262 RepID=UPI00041577FA|nr:TraU family protein [Thermodesulfovibrio islandicus]